MKDETRHASPSSETETVEEVARRLGIGRDLAYRAVRAGDIPSIRIGRRILVPKAELERLLRGEWRGGPENEGTAS